MAPKTSSQQLVDVARELNQATRFGRMNLAAEHTEQASTASFLQRRRKWGNEIRVFDVNLAEVQLLDDKHAELLVSVQWTQIATSTLRNTTVKQFWSSDALKGWTLTRERRASGDFGLFGEKVPERPRASRHDVHFPSRTLGKH